MQGIDNFRRRSKRDDFLLLGDGFYKMFHEDFTGLGDSKIVLFLPAPGSSKPKNKQGL